MLWLLLGTAILGVLLLTLRAFERASVGSIYLLLKWIGAFGGIALTALLLLSGRGPQALAGLVMVGPLLWRRWHQGGTGSGGGGFRGQGFGGGGYTGSAGTRTRD